MELCTSRHFLLSLFILQLVVVSVRQLFDFLGFMWASVLANFVYTLLIIFGIFGLVQLKPKYSIAYTICSFYWIFWNLFIMCIYFKIFGLNKFQNILSFGTDSISWWEHNGPGCKVFISNFTLVHGDPSVTPDVNGCVLDFQYVEGIQAAIHTILAVWGFLFGLKVSHDFIKQNDTSESYKKKGSSGLPLYSIEYNNRKQDNLYDNENQSTDSDGEMDTRGKVGGNRPMTPRRVKRRSIHSKSTSTLTQQHPKPNHQPPPYIRRPPYGSLRSTGRNSARRSRHVQNPVSKFLDYQQQQQFYHQQMLNDSSTSNDSYRIPINTQRSQVLNPSELVPPVKPPNGHSFGHVNPSFVSTISLERPPSARSSYSNYHGVRTLAFSSQATPQVPSNSMRRNSNSRSAYSTFLSDGPPAYDINRPIDSETVI